MTEHLEKLLDYCKMNGRVCPQPMKWKELWEMLPDRKQVDAGWNPPLPLILGAWQESDEFKRQRLKEHLIYADQKGGLDKVALFLKSLPEHDWFHDSE